MVKSIIRVVGPVAVAERPDTVVLYDETQEEIGRAEDGTSGAVVLGVRSVAQPGTEISVLRGRPSGWTVTVEWLDARGRPARATQWFTSEQEAVAYAEHQRIPE